MTSGMLVGRRKAVLVQVDASGAACNLYQGKGELVIYGIGHGDTVEAESGLLARLLDTAVPIYSLTSG